jgi:hypothetical protein
MAIAVESLLPTGLPAMEAVDTLNCGNGRGIADAATTATTREQMLAPVLASASSPMAAAMMVITRRPSPKRWRIAGSNRKSRCKSSDGSAEGEDHLQR